MTGAGSLRSASAGKIETMIEEALDRHGSLEPGEVVTHFDLVVETRRVDDEGVEHVRRLRWSPVGSNPHLSYGLLSAEAERIKNKIV
jgi:hypothetical protein